MAKRVREPRTHLPELHIDPRLGYRRTYCGHAADRVKCIDLATTPVDDATCRMCHRVDDAREGAAYRQAKLAAVGPCPHPARKGRHEWYVDPMTGGGNCRACGAEYPL